jgi:hypothetical protein
MTLAEPPSVCWLSGKALRTLLEAPFTPFRIYAVAIVRRPSSFRSPIGFQVFAVVVHMANANARPCGACIRMNTTAGLLRASWLNRP